MYVDKGWKRIRKIWKKANVCWHMGAPLKNSPIVVLASVKTESGWKSLSFGLTGNAHSHKLDKALCDNREMVKNFTPEQIKSIVPGTLSWLNVNRVVWSIFVGGLMNEKTDRYITPPAVTLPDTPPSPVEAHVETPDWEKEALDALNWGIAQGEMLLGLNPGTLGRKPARTEIKPVVAPVTPPAPVIDVKPVVTDASQDIINTDIAPADRMTNALELAAQFVDGSEIPKFCVFDCKKRPSEGNCANCPFFRNRPLPKNHFNALMYPKGVKALRFRNNPYWENDIITEERRARADELDTYDDTLVAKFCVEGCTKRARADLCAKCKYCTCAAGAEKEFAAQIRKARLLVK